MNVQQLEQMARAHWMAWRPEECQEMEAEGILDSNLRAAAVAAKETIDDLIQQGYQMHEAEEVALKTYILKEPEGDGLEDWEREELAEKERRFWEIEAAVAEINEEHDREIEAAQEEENQRQLALMKTPM